MRYEIDERRRLLRAIPEREEDLYFLYLLIDRGDVIRGWTVREVRPEGAKRGERVKLYLGVRAESLEYHKFRGTLRVRGVVVEVSGDFEGVRGRWHTIEIAPGREVEIVKAGEWPLGAVLETLEVARVSLPRVLLVSVDDEEAAVAYITSLGLEIAQLIYNRARGGGGDMVLGAEYVSAIRQAVEELRRRRGPDRVIVAGPAMVAEYVARHVPGAAAVPQGSGGAAGVYEFIRSGAYERLKDALGLSAYERLIRTLATARELVAVGIDEVREAASSGRVETLLVLDEYLKESPESAWSVMLQVHRTGGRVRILRGDSEAGAGLRAMGFMAALLRW